jgi:hypothetical protein
VISNAIDTPKKRKKKKIPDATDSSWGMSKYIISDATDKLLNAYGMRPIPKKGKFDVSL